MMKPFDLHIAYVAWGDNGKRRPVLILTEEDGEISAFQITSKFKNKSAAIQSQYFTIEDWKEAGLDKPSYIDIGKIIELPTAMVDSSSIGKLTEKDKNALIEKIDL